MIGRGRSPRFIQPQELVYPREVSCVHEPRAPGARDLEGGRVGGGEARAAREVDELFTLPEDRGQAARASARERQACGKQDENHS